LAHFVAALRPRPDTERQAPILAMAGDLVGALDPVVMRKYLGDAIHYRNRRIVRMQRQPHVRLLGNRENSLDEVGIVGPDVVRRILALEAGLFNLGVKLIAIELPDLVAARRFDDAGGVRVARVEIDLAAVDSEAAEVAEEGLELFD